MTQKYGLVVNPIAGVGAELAWKGTDDVTAAWDAVERGEKQPVWKILDRALRSIPSNITIEWLLGGITTTELNGEIIYDLPSRSTAQDTHAIVEILVHRNVDLIIFVGGDGTAADVAQHSNGVPIIGIPGGVKIFSPCFLHRPEDLGMFIENWEGETMEVDILDLDEQAYRQGQAKPKLITSALIPVSSTIQLGKISWSSADESTFRLIAERIEEENMLQKIIMVGPGSTMRNIFRQFGVELSLLGVDVVHNGEILVLDGTTEDLRKISIDELWLSPIGNQGHILGRGNRQIPISLLSGITKKQLRIFSTVDKIQNTPTLYVDSGDPTIDENLRGYYPVIVGYHEEIMRKVE